MLCVLHAQDMKRKLQWQYKFTLQKRPNVFHQILTFPLFRALKPRKMFSISFFTRLFVYCRCLFTCVSTVVFFFRSFVRSFFLLFPHFSCHAIGYQNVWQEWTIVNALVRPVLFIAVFRSLSLCLLHRSPHCCLFEKSFSLAYVTTYKLNRIGIVPFHVNSVVLCILIRSVPVIVRILYSFQGRNDVSIIKSSYFWFHSVWNFRFSFFVRILSFFTVGVVLFVSVAIFIWFFAHTFDVNVSVVCDRNEHNIQTNILKWNLWPFQRLDSWNN